MPEAISKGRFSIKTKRSFLIWLLATIGLVFITLFVIKFWDWFSTTQQVNIPPSSVTITKSTSKPNEAKVDVNKDTYRVPADQPRLIEITAINVKGYVQQVGIDQNNAIATPSNIHMAGWYNGSTKPGGAGISVIDGHVNGRYESAIFYRLHELKPGDSIKIIYGDGRSVNFITVRTAQYDEDKTAEHIFEKLADVDSQLVLITCGGKFDKSTNRYSQRVLVYAKAITN